MVSEASKTIRRTQASHPWLPKMDSYLHVWHPFMVGDDGSRSCCLPIYTVGKRRKTSDGLTTWLTHGLLLAINPWLSPGYEEHILLVMWHKRDHIGILTSILLLDFFWIGDLWRELEQSSQFSFNEQEQELHWKHVYWRRFSGVTYISLDKICN